ncbi:MAG: Lrp/AsnC family transcriptional regulator [Candidatus Nanohaloarchaea archaeon]
MDSKDRKIIQILKENGRASFTEIAEEVDVSEATVRNRVREMQDSGIIEKFTVETSEAENSALVMVKLETGIDIDEVVDKLPADLVMKEVTGEYDLVLELSEQSPEELNSLLDQIRAVSGVRDTMTYTVLKQRKL